MHPQPSPKQKTILIVEDDELLAHMYQLKLEYAGYSVILAHTAAEAQQIIRKQPLDLIILDILLPRVNGLVVLKDIRKDVRTMHCPVIVLTNLSNTEVDMHDDVADALGVVAYLVKSKVTPAQVLKAVAAALKD